MEKFNTLKKDKKVLIAFIGSCLFYWLTFSFIAYQTDFRAWGGVVRMFYLFAILSTSGYYAYNLIHEEEDQSK